MVTKMTSDVMVTIVTGDVTFTIVTMVNSHDNPIFPAHVTMVRTIVLMSVVMPSVVSLDKVTLRPLMVPTLPTQTPTAVSPLLESAHPHKSSSLDTATINSITLVMETFEVTVDQDLNVAIGTEAVALPKTYSGLAIRKAGFFVILTDSTFNIRFSSDGQLYIQVCDC
eukprot:sb/3472381/